MQETARLLPKVSLPFRLLALALFLIAGRGSALADRFVPIPGGGAAQEDLKMRVVRYDGGTNGEMVIEVTNRGRTTSNFSAEGIFFVPKGDPESAPQRLGAAGPILELAGENKGKRSDTVAIAPGTTRRLRLDVFCIDSHRSSPDSSTSFRVAKNKLPKKLRREISVGNRAILRAKAGKMSAAKADIQSHMWKTRDKDWIKLEGERANEKGAPRRHRHMQNRMRSNDPIEGEPVQRFAEPPPVQRQGK